jgi:predicted secreted Zn-dependent protease
MVSQREEVGRVRLSEAVYRQTYTVAGATPAEVRASLNESRPSAPKPAGGGGIGRFDGLTDWSLRWSFAYQRSAGDCSLSRATIELTTVVVLPHLAETGLAAPDLRWTEYIAALEAHEMGHVSLQRDLSRELAAEIESVPAQATCGDLGRQLNALGERYVDLMRRADAAYDVETGHGVRQGAVYP